MVLSPDETARLLIQGAANFLEGGLEYRMYVAAAIVDQLVGNDPRALLKGVDGLPDGMDERITDAVIQNMRDKIIELMKKAR